MTTAEPTLPLTAELVLLILDDRSGKPMIDSTRRKAAVAGAAVLQLVLDGTLDLEPGEPRRARLVATPGGVPRSQLFAEVLERANGQRPKNAVARIGGASDWRNRANGIQDATLEELEDSGIVEVVEHRTLGLVPTRRWVLRRPEVESAIVARIGAVLDGGAPDAHTAALASVADAVGLLPKLFPDRDKKAMKQRAKELGELQWAGRPSHRP